MNTDKNSVCCNGDCNQGRTCPVRLGTYKTAEAVHETNEPISDLEATHMRDLTAYRTTVENLERKVAELEAAPAAQAVEPEFFTVFASHNGGKIALPGYSNETEKGVKDLVLQAARQEGYKGTVSGRLLELGWWIGPVFASPSEAAAPAPAAVAVADGWQPIAAAQKSGRTLMLGFFNESGKWRTTRGQWFTQEHIDDTWEDADDCKAGWYETPVVGEDCYPVAPTHWMPLPTAPGSTPSTAAPAIPAADFQQRVQPWMLACFGAAISADVSERNHRFLEEALELVQACGCTGSEARQLVDYVYGRPLGEKHQEVGGMMVTLAALCLAQGLDMHAAGDTELARIWTKVDAIREKQAAKPKHSPLPMHAPQAQDVQRDAGDLYYLQDARWSGMVGNCPSFWRKGGGYTTNLDEAERFTLDAAMRQHSCRDTDLPWLCSEIDKLRRPTVDCQYMPRSWDDQRAAIAASAAQGGAA